MNKFDLQRFAYDDNEYCDFTSEDAQAKAGIDVLLCIFDATGAKLLAITGQQSLTINRSADTIEMGAKDMGSGWKIYLPAGKEWSVDSDGLYVQGADSHKALAAAFENNNHVCVKVIDAKEKKGMFGGVAYVTTYNVEAPYDDGMTYSITLQGSGKLTDLTIDAPSTDTMPEGYEGE